MSDEKHEQSEEPQEQVDAENDAQAAADDGQEQTDQQRIAELEGKVADLSDQVLRARADYQNLARRSELNVSAAREEGVRKVARELITVLDHFDRALQLDPEQTDAQTVLDGIASVKSELIRAMSTAGVERIDVEPGTEFDPNEHEALMRQPSDSHETNQVVMQLQPGYRLEGRLIRPAQVAVAE